MPWAQSVHGISAGCGCWVHWAALQLAGQLCPWRSAQLAAQLAEWAWSRRVHRGDSLAPGAIAPCDATGRDVLKRVTAESRWHMCGGTPPQGHAATAPGRVGVRTRLLGALGFGLGGSCRAWARQLAKVEPHRRRGDGPRHARRGSTAGCDVYYYGRVSTPSHCHSGFLGSAGSTVIIFYGNVTRGPQTSEDPVLEERNEINSKRCEEQFNIVRYGTDSFGLLQLNSKFGNTTE